jgi:hypothetical protein
MPEWWEYALSDFLLFSPRTYYRLLERYNEAVWPIHVAMLGLGFLILLLLLRHGVRRQGTAISLIMATLWAWVAWVFLWRRYAAINWAVVYLIPLFALHVLLLTWTGVVRRNLSFRANGGAAHMIGFALLLFSLFCYPGLALLAGRPSHQAELFGVVPDPTVMASLALVPLAEGRVRWELLPVPMLWCVFSGLTLWAMGSPEAWIVFTAAGLALFASLLRSKPSNGSSQERARSISSW